MNKIYLLLAVLLAGSMMVYGTPPSWQWMQRTTGTGECTIYKIINDSQGRIIVSGRFTETVILGDTSLDSAGSSDAFVAKLDANGNWLWAISMGGAGSDYAYHLAVDSGDNIYVDGSFDQSFALGAITLPHQGSNDIFITKLSDSGAVLNAFTIGAAGSDQPKGLAVSPAGEVFCSGTYRNGLSIGGIALPAVSTGLFLGKLDNQLNPIWAHGEGGPQYPPDCGNLGTDSAGNCIMIGNFDTSCSFGSGNVVSLTSNGSSGFVVKFDGNGSALWADRVGSGSCAIIDSYIDSAGNAYMACDIVFTPYFPGDETRLDTIPRIGKISSNGQWQWYETFSAMEGCVNIKTCGDDEGNCYATGFLWDNYTFGEYALIGDFMTDNVFVSKANANGNWQWGLQTLDAEMMFYLSISDICFQNGDKCVIAGGNSSESLHFGDFFIDPSPNQYSFIIGVNGTAVSAEDPALVPQIPVLAIYPNPSAQVVCFDLQGEKSGYTHAEIYNIRGQRVKAFSKNDLKGKSAFSWDGLDEKGKPCSAGVYIMKLNTGKEVLSKSFTRF